MKDQIIDPKDYDPGWPGDVDYLDWILLIKDVDQYTPKIIEHHIQYHREARRLYESGKVIKRGASSAEVTKELRSLIPVKEPEKPMKRRKVIND